MGCEFFDSALKLGTACAGICNPQGFAVNLKSNWGANALSNSCHLCCLRSRKYKFKTEAIREARAREQARGAQGPGNPEQARRGEGGKGRGWGGEQ